MNGPRWRNAAAPRHSGYLWLRYVTLGSLRLLGLDGESALGRNGDAQSVRFVWSIATGDDVARRCCWSQAPAWRGYTAMMLNRPAPVRPLPDVGGTGSRWPLADADGTFGAWRFQLSCAAYVEGGTRQRAEPPAIDCASGRGADRRTTCRCSCCRVTGVGSGSATWSGCWRPSADTEGRTVSDVEIAHGLRSRPARDTGFTLVLAPRRLMSMLMACCIVPGRCCTDDAGGGY